MFHSLPTRVFLAGLLLTAVATAASAEPGVVNDDGSMTEQVSSSGLDLGSPLAQATMKRRIEMAVRRVCGSDDQGGLLGQMAYQSCHEDAMADAMGQLTMLVARASGHDMVVVALADTQH
ncbi:MAG: UrcA family protein [Janthinobacterium lividum]